MWTCTVYTHTVTHSDTHLVALPHFVQLGKDHDAIANVKYNQVVTEQAKGADGLQLCVVDCIAYMLYIACTLYMLKGMSLLVQKTAGYQLR